MIIARIRGGLGNQLFQYAAARALAWYKGVPLKLDLYTYDKRKSRSFGLDQFKIDATLATRSEVHQFTGSNFLVRFLNKRENYLRCPQVLSQPHYHFYSDFFSMPTPIYLSGYWQSEKYFVNFDTQLRQQILLNRPLGDSAAKWKGLIEKNNSIAIHIRRGDYSANSNYNSFFGTLPISYYEKALEEMKRKVSAPQFFVFSDDLEWCKQNLSFLADVTFVSHNEPVSPAEDLILMSFCKHQIIANSTFSWWGAWLNRNPEKQVIAPGTWFQSSYSASKLPIYAVRYYNTKDLLPESWIKL